MYVCMHACMYLYNVFKVNVVKYFSVGVFDLGKENLERERERKRERERERKREKEREREKEKERESERETSRSGMLPKHLSSELTLAPCSTRNDTASLWPAHMRMHM